MRRIGWFVTAVLASLIVGTVTLGVAYFDRSSQVVAGTVVERRELATSIGPGLDWRPRHEVLVTYKPRHDESLGSALGRRLERALYNRTGILVQDNTEHVFLASDADTYDRLRPGATVSVRYVPLAPSQARLDTYSLVEALQVGTPLGSYVSGQGLVIALLAAAPVVLFATRRLLGHSKRTLGMLTALCWLQAFALAAVGTRDLTPTPPGPHRSTTATIQDVRLFEEINRRRHSAEWPLAQAVERVLLTFVPAGWDQPVVAVDDVDRGSVAGLAMGATVAITYAEVAPRQAEIVGASRGHRWSNRLAVHGFFLGLVALPVVFFLLGRRRRPRPRLGRRAERPPEVPMGQGQP